MYLQRSIFGLQFCQLSFQLDITLAAIPHKSFKPDNPLRAILKLRVEIPKVSPLQITQYLYSFHSSRSTPLHFNLKLTITSSKTLTQCKMFRLNPTKFVLGATFPPPWAFNLSIHLEPTIPPSRCQSVDNNELRSVSCSFNWASMCPSAFCSFSRVFCISVIRDSHSLSVCRIDLLDASRLLAWAIAAFLAKRSLSRLSFCCLLLAP